MTAPIQKTVEEPTRDHNLALAADRLDQIVSAYLAGDCGPSPVRKAQQAVRLALSTGRDRA